MCYLFNIFISCSTKQMIINILCIFKIIVILLKHIIKFYDYQIYLYLSILTFQSFNVSQIIPDYANEEITPCIFMPTNTTCLNLNMNDI